ncbi:MAG: hypothetical protein FD139_2639 [Methylocystaceae bacterium]|nr:MAG: hypothetical protein FD148_3565 [Methylocystaceae bacterium]KAF0214186.1 MAG: hypothetical protein FD172_57 [Methylocystaceae bacterium]TXT43949.1 MAG: hypothetical protein FD139_2639 [Methylocystaceae bacterium]
MTIKTINGSGAPARKAVLLTRVPKFRAAFRSGNLAFWKSAVNASLAYLKAVDSGTFLHEFFGE